MADKQPTPTFRPEVMLAKTRRRMGEVILYTSPKMWIALVLAAALFVLIGFIMLGIQIEDQNLWQHLFDRDALP